MAKKKAKKKATKKKLSKAAQAKADKIEALREFAKKQQKRGVHVSLGVQPRGRRMFRFPPFNELTGGAVKGSWVVFWGQEDSGKTTAALDLAVEALENGECVAIVDVEGTLLDNPAWLRGKGIDPDNPLIMVIQGPTIEALGDSLIEAVKEGHPGLIIIDSISAMSPRGENEDKKGKARGMDNDTMGLRARQGNKLGRMLIASGFSLQDMTIVMIAQTYTNIKVHGMQTISMGSNLKYLSFLRLQFGRGPKAGWPGRRMHGEKDDELIGFTSQIKLEKVKQDGTKRPGTIIQVPFIHGYGFHYAKYLWDQAKDLGLISNASAKWMIGGDRLTFIGKANMHDWLYDTPDKAVKLLTTLIDEYYADLEKEEDDGEIEECIREPITTDQYLDPNAVGEEGDNNNG